MSIRDAVERLNSEKAKNLAEEYFKPSDMASEAGLYTGAHFETLGADENLSNRITASDLLAVQCLSVNVPARATIGILGTLANDISSLLSGIPSTTRLKDLRSEDQFESTLGKDSPALQLWDLLRRNGADEVRWGVGPTIASKIMARKRPQLIPVQDSVVDRVIHRGRRNSWRLWWEALADDDYLEDRASEVRDHIGRPTLSTLRTLDIVLWKSGK